MSLPRNNERAPAAARPRKTGLVRGACGTMIFVPWRSGVQACARQQTRFHLDVSQATAAFLERRIMKKLNKVAMLFASAALVAPISSTYAAPVDPARVDN